ncbi:hypothetical protein J1605_013819 [Eschrichtius robustus]|uniref:Uncharacterized protein n=1 Tax=Eschrichtius robustus TaxID=9764 RepID=A0AB34GEY6_ESCRO|nr:hypothetical protein J1605_013819 [Eschrichtius robustus]
MEALPQVQQAKNTGTLITFSLICSKGEVSMPAEASQGDQRLQYKLSSAHNAGISPVQAVEELQETLHTAWESHGGQSGPFLQYQKSVFCLLIAPSDHKGTDTEVGSHRRMPLTTASCSASG